MGRHERGQDGDGRRDHAAAEADEEERAVFADEQPFERTRAEADGEQQGQFAAALEDVAQHDHAEADAAEQQAEAAENLEGAEVGVLHGVELREAARGGGEFETTVAEGAGELRGCVGCAVGRGIHEEKAVAALAGEARGERVFGDNDVALED